MIAAANPIGGRYDQSFNFSENVELTDPIIQRFDILCVLQDVVDPIADEKLARFVVASHMRSHPNYAHSISLNMLPGASEVKDGGDDEAGGMYGSDIMDDDLQLVDQILLKKYIAYARANVKPILHDVDSEKVFSSSP